MCGINIIGFSLYRKQWDPGWDNVQKWWLWMCVPSGCRTRCGRMRSSSGRSHLSWGSQVLVLLPASYIGFLRISSTKRLHRRCAQMASNCTGMKHTPRLLFWIFYFMFACRKTIPTRLNVDLIGIKRARMSSLPSTPKCTITLRVRFEWIRFVWPSIWFFRNRITVNSYWISNWKVYVFCGAGKYNVDSFQFFFV